VEFTIFNRAGASTDTPKVRTTPTSHSTGVLTIAARLPTNSSSVRIALVNRPSFGSVSRRTNSRSSRRVTTRDNRDRDAFVTSASELMRLVRCGLSDSMAKTWYSTIPSLESRCSCWSIDQGSQVINRTTESQESSSSAVRLRSVARSTRS